ncbi:MAG: AraC family transcriptional regulator [Candidatus Cohnella colombiensis]|uniref:AraC family transcriptional regulator n=1 Tax=Candidatus Cohnella colombiensis TaxID=3121368 RepID=A0AA95F611_9BACL|nr:MAG: AraC family transcriptional regulator [Cohnella sp.]
MMNQRVVPSIPLEPLPLQLETIGTEDHQESFEREDGYPCFHWLQTLEGEGEITVNHITYKLPERSGFLLYPNVPHRYQAKTHPWKTAYITYDGHMAATLTTTLHGITSEKFQWDQEQFEMTNHIDRILTLALSGTDPSGWSCSAELYRFLTLLKTNSRIKHLPSLSKRYERIQHLLQWLENKYANPDLGLADMAKQLNISGRQLNERFREAFGQTAYAYLIQLRLRKAKEWLPARTDLTVRDIAESVGFRDASHFIAVFRQHEGLTPDRYRRLYRSTN